MSLFRTKSLQSIVTEIRRGKTQVIYKPITERWPCYDVHTCSCPLPGWVGSRQNENKALSLSPSKVYFTHHSHHLPPESACPFSVLRLSRCPSLEPNSTGLDNGPDLLMILCSFPTTHFINPVLSMPFSHVFIGSFFYLLKLKRFLLSPVRGRSVTLIRPFLSVQPN